MRAIHSIFTLFFIFYLTSGGYIWVKYTGCLTPWENTFIRRSCVNGVCADETPCNTNITQVGSFVVALAMGLGTLHVPCTAPEKLCDPGMLIQWLQDHNAFTNPPADSPIQTNTDVLLNNFGIQEIIYTKNGYAAQRDDVYNLFYDTVNIILIKLRTTGSNAYCFVTDAEKAWYGDDKPINYNYTLYNPLSPGYYYGNDSDFESAYIFVRKRSAPSTFLA